MFDENIRIDDFDTQIHPEDLREYKEYLANEEIKNKDDFKEAM